MILGPTLIRQCSACSQLIEEWTFLSSNNIGIISWTDGEYFAMMLPNPPALVKCPHCNELLWIAELELLGDKGDNHSFEDRKMTGNRKKEFVGSLPYNTPGAEDYFAMLKKGVSGRAKVFYLRLRSWRAGNDVRRESAECPGMFKKPEGGTNPPLSNDEIENMLALADLLSEKKHSERLLKAEIMRELSRFDQALVLLSKPYKPELRRIAIFIRKLTENKDPLVKELC